MEAKTKEKAKKEQSSRMVITTLEQQLINE